MEIDEKNKEKIIKDYKDQIEFQIDNLREFVCSFGAIITNDATIYNNLLKYTQDFLRHISCSISMNYTVVCLPSLASPVAFHNSHIVFLFADNVDQYLFQYAHELCHVQLGPFPQQLKWFAELLCCSCSYFCLDVSNSSRFFELEHSPKTFEQNLANYVAIKYSLSSDPYTVYNSEKFQFKTLIYRYYELHPDFDFFGYLNRAIAYRDNCDYLIALWHELLP